VIDHLVAVLHAPHTGCGVLIDPKLEVFVLLLLLQEFAALVKEILLEGSHSLSQIENFGYVKVGWGGRSRSFDEGSALFFRLLSGS
jgi:hypothetical protein